MLTIQRFFLTIGTLLALSGQAIAQEAATLDERVNAIFAASTGSSMVFSPPSLAQRSLGS
jgi:AGCS family alanine or glycine:cation symporter